ncbi:putative Sensor protein (Modular protein) [Planktothrix serta PCC 8927]|uniref:histidine kinase n=1 Tax=Planktothrix serta PCC 8927 TaxID=671068 RepID=A0A7Z9BP45_9CYAN|nr:ATP-binding protein [Planktothrix serta]VXD19387.1 putative Sensor protein (Modular protein) [Planktothrix serta PCC 8927]
MLLLLWNQFVAKTIGKLPLRTVLILPFVVQITATVGLVGYFSFKNGQKAVENLAQQLMNQVSDRVQENLQFFLETPTQINQTNSNQIKLGFLNTTNLYPWEKYLWRQVQLYPDITFIAIATNQNTQRSGEKLLNGNFQVNVVGDDVGNNFYAFKLDPLGNRNQGKLIKKDYDLRQHPTYLKVIKERRGSWSNVFVSILEPSLLISALEPIYNQKQEIEGIFLATLRLDQIITFLKGLKIGKSGQVFILDPEGHLLASSTGEQPFRKIESQNQLFLGIESRNDITQSATQQLLRNFKSLHKIDQPTKIDFSIDQEKYFLNVIPFTDNKKLEWLIVLVVPENDFLDEIKANNRTTLLLCLVTLIVAITMGILTARWVTLPIIKLNIASKNIAAGQWDQALETNRQDELGELTRSFNYMIQQLQTTLTQMQELNQSLQISEQRYASLAQAAPVGIFRTDIEGNFIYGNDQNFAMMGLSPEETMGMGWTKTIHPEDRDRTLSSWLEFVQKDVAFQCEYRCIRPDGTTIWVYGKALAERNTAGEITGYVGTITDITSTKEAERILAEYNQTLERQVQERTQELSQALQQLKATQSQLIQSEKMAALGQLVAGIAHEINTPLGAIQAAINNNNQALIESLSELPKLYQKLDLDQQYLFFSLLARSRANPQQLSTREQREYKRQLNQVLKDYQIESPRKIADILVDIGIYQHLESILPILQHPEQEWLLTLAYNLARLQRNNQTMITAIERASKVVFALKSYARYDNSNLKQSVLITEGIDTVLELYHNQLKRGIEVNRLYQITHPLDCYPDELMQVWTNLIHNSIQAMNGKGNLKILVQEEETEFVVQITDSGGGISADIQDRIFEPFFTTKPRGEGSGLGLDIVKKIIDKHQGQISVQSQPGTTIFRISLPRS